MMKPPIRTLSPVSTRRRVEIFPKTPVAGVTVDVAVGVAAAVAVGVTVAVAVGVAEGTTVAVGVGIAPVAYKSARSSSGPVPVPPAAEIADRKIIPALKTMKLGDARQRLASLGIPFKIEEGVTPTDGTQVQDTNPPEGALLAAGEKLTLVLYK